jgi:hypothetical protein
MSIKMGVNKKTSVRRLPKGICDFCGDGEVPVVDLGKMGPRACGLSACERCCKAMSHPWPEAAAKRT